MTQADEARALEREAERLRAAYQRIRERLAERIVGQPEVVRGALVALLAGGHVLLEGAPGLGKTLLVHTLAASIGARFQRVQCTPDLMPADVLGTRILVEDERGGRRLSFEPGPIFTEVLLADEVNRATPRTQSALLEAMQEGAVTLGGARHPLPDLFLVLATQNPIDMEGTYPLPEAQLDRFLFKLHVGAPDLGQLREIATRTTGGPAPALDPVLATGDVLALRRLIERVPLAPRAVELAARLVHATHPDRPDAPPALRRGLRYGASPRGVQALVRAARVEALLDGRYVVAADDVRAWALPALRHRLILSYEAEAEGVTQDALVRTLLEAVPDPEV
ncbi:MAG: MoxR family ATPase [Planctomycetes bacterium]|nr:MoxR family ATPase [Planctomycetota bacterium]